MVATAWAPPVLRGTAGPEQLVAGLAVVALASWQLGWGLATLAARTAPAAVAAAAIGSAGAAGWLAAGAAGSSVALWTAVPAAVLSGAAPLLARWSRTRAGAGEDPGRGAPVLALAVAAVAVAALATPAVAATPAGQGAPDHHGAHP